MLRYFFLYITTCIISFSTFAYDGPKIHFRQDSIKIGEIVKLDVKISYPSNELLLLPDSTANLYPFEIIGVKDYGSILKNDTITDSVTYLVTTFELFKEQILQLPAYFIQESDSTTVYSNHDTLWVHFVTTENDTSLVADTEWVPYPFSEKPDYMVFIITIIIIVILLSFVVNIIGPPIYKKLKVKRLKNTVNQEIKKIKSSETLHQEHASVVQQSFRKALSKLYSQDVRAFTSKEIHQLTSDDTLYKHLRNLDAIVYGNSISNNEQTIDYLVGYLQVRLEIRQKELIDGSN